MKLSKLNNYYVQQQLSQNIIYQQTLKNSTHTKMENVCKSLFILCAILTKQDNEKFNQFTKKIKET